MLRSTEGDTTGAASAGSHERSRWIERWEVTVPTILLVIVLILLLTGGALGLSRRRRRGLSSSPARTTARLLGLDGLRVTHRSRPEPNQT